MSFIFGGLLKKLIFLVILTVLFPEFLLPQDSLFYKSIFTNKFDLTINKNPEKIPQKEFNAISYDFDEVYKDCQIIDKITDSSFYVHYNSKKELILFKNITEISFKGKNHKG